MVPQYIFLKLGHEEIFPGNTDPEGGHSEMVPRPSR